MTDNKPNMLPPDPDPAAAPAPASPPAPPPAPAPFADRAASAAFLGLMRAARLLPYERRVAAAGRFTARVIAPLLGWRARVRENLALVRPDLGPAEAARIAREVADNVGRAMAETYSGAEFAARVPGAALFGPGLQVLEGAAGAGRPVILACAHFGNYDALRAALKARGWPVGGLYRPMSNEAFNAHYVPAIETISTPLFPRGRQGLTAMLRFLRGGGILCLGFDQHVRDGATLQFFGQPAETALTPAELALRYDAVLMPANAIRQPDGVSFRVQIGAPVPPGEPAAMMQALNDDLEALIRAHMGQWFWVHRRWKSRRKSA